jgi:carbamoyltransferase
MSKKSKKAKKSKKIKPVKKNTISKKANGLPTISVVMIAKDEEHYLPGALSSVVEWADEIILVDTGSTDRTVVIAQSFGALVHHQTWQNDFSLHRNKAMELASCDWCLQLDADEALDSESAGRLKELAAATRADALMVNIVNVMGAGATTSFDYPRFFRNKKGIYYYRKVHNQIHIPGPIDPSPITLLHYGYAAEDKIMNERHARRIKMMRSWAAEEPTNHESHYYLSQTLVSQEETAPEAVKCAQRAVELAKQNGVSPEVYAKYYLPMLQALNQLENHQEMFRLAGEWSRLQHDNPDPRLFGARAAYGMKQWGMVAQISEEFVMLHRESVRKQQQGISVTQNSSSQLFSILVIWCVAEAMLGRDPKVAEIILAIKRLPNAAKVVELLIEEAQKHGVSEKMIQLERDSLKIMLPRLDGQKPYRILSLYFGHDANLCLMENGRPLLVLEKERVSRIKHDKGHMMDVLPQVLQEHGWSPQSIDLVAINPMSVADRKNRSFEWDVTGSFFTKTSSYDKLNWSGSAVDRTSFHKLRILGRQIDCVAIDHHLAHAALAFFSSPFDEAGILSADGGGDDRYLAAAFGKGNQLEWLEYDWGHDRGTEKSLMNIGSTWSNIGEMHFGYQRLEGAGKLMGLASYGKVDENLKRHLLRHCKYYWPYPLPLKHFDQPHDLDPLNPFAQNLCATLQEMTNEVYMQAAKYLHKLSPSPNICLTGGCAMNCVVNSLIHTSGLFRNSFVPAQPHDGGLALGQALYVWHHVMDQPRNQTPLSPYLGTDIGPAPLGAIDEMVKALAAGKIVALAHGKAESGPRALGHRSILADPRNPKVRTLINRQVKRREWYRPFAPMVLAEEMDKWFLESVPSWYMSYVVSARPGLGEMLPGVIHVDGTARPQVVEPHHDPMTRALMEAWRDHSGIGVLLNTSFNCQEPLVDSMAHVKNTFARTDIDVLVTPQGVERK